MSNHPTHLLSTLGVLSHFNIVKVISKKDVIKTTKEIKKYFKGNDTEKFQKLFIDSLVAKAKESVSKELPPGLIMPERNLKKEKLDKYYMELAAVSQTLCNKFREQKLTKDQTCFIINSMINVLGIEDSDFENFYESFQKYKDDVFDEEE